MVIQAKCYNGLLLHAEIVHKCEHLYAGILFSLSIISFADIVCIYIYFSVPL